MMLARANALSTATNSGAGDSSALGGAYGSIAGQGNTGLLGVSQNQQLGNQIFAANQQANQGASQVALGGAFSTVGGQVLQNKADIRAVGSIF